MAHRKSATGVIVLATLLLGSTLLAFLPMAPVVEAPSHSTQVETEFILMTPIRKSSYDPVLAGFRSHIFKKFGTNITTRSIEGRSPELLARALSWGGKPDADIFWGGEYHYYPQLTTKNLLVPFKGENFGQVPDNFQGFRLKEGTGQWIAVSFFTPGHFINSQALEREKLAVPQTWDDLLKPIYRDHIVMTAPDKSGGLHTDVELVLQARGEEQGWAYWRRLAGNVGFWAASSGDVESRVKSGERAIGIAIAETSAVLARGAGSPIIFVYPADSSALVPSAAAILAGTKHPQLAKEFMNYILSKESQERFLSGGLVPARQDIEFSKYPNIPNAKLLREVMNAENVYQLKAKIFALDFELIERRFRAVNEFFNQNILNKKDELRAAWDKLIAADAAIAQAKADVAKLEQQGFDTQRAKEALTAAGSALTGAYASYDKGEFKQALTTAEGALTTAQGAAGKAERIPFYVQYSWAIAAVIVVVIVVAAVALRRR